MLILHTYGRLLSEWLITHTLHRSVPGTFLLLSVSLKTQWSVGTGFTGRHTSVCFSVCVGPDSHGGQNSPGFWGRSDSNMVMQKQVIENQIKTEQRKRRRGGIDRGEAEKGRDWEVFPRKSSFFPPHFFKSNNCFFYFQTFPNPELCFKVLPGSSGAFCVSPTTDSCLSDSGGSLEQLWITIMSQHSVPASSVSVTRLSCCYLNK